MNEMDREFFGVSHRATLLRDKHIARSQKIKAYHNALAQHKLRQKNDEDDDEDDDFDPTDLIDGMSPEMMEDALDLISSTSEFIEGLLVGAIEGLTRDYNRKCSESLIASIGSFFLLVDKIEFWKPANFAKFQLSNTEFMEDTNHVYARCHYTDFSRSFAGFFDFSDPMEMVPKVSRSFGIYLSEGPALVDCASYGYSTSNGYDCGNCSANLVALIFNANL